MAHTSDLHSFQYDRFQQEALEALNTDASLLVSAPTGAGKTVIADHVISRARARGERVIYTAPIKALSNQKYREFTALYGGDVGILTGDVALNTSAPVCVMTTEIYRNTLLDTPDEITTAAWVIFDEVHYLDDRERGTVWEEAIMLTPLTTRLLCLSATVPNNDEIAQWMSSVLGRTVTVITEEKRPVPLHFIYQCNGALHTSWKKLAQYGYGPFTAKIQQYAQQGKKGPRKHTRRQSRRMPEITLRPNRLHSLMQSVINSSRLPCIYFTFSRRRTEELAREVMHMDFPVLDNSVQLDARYQALCARYGVTEEPSAKALRECVRRGIAYHHAGMLPTLKEIVEQMFTARLLAIVFTTETFALGINMPARTVIFDELRKYYGTGFDTLRSRDFYQMAGRAGRRGMDDAGFVYVRVLPTQITLPALKDVIYGTPQPVISQFNASYATLLNLYQHHGDDVVSLYPYTLHAYQSSARGQKRALKRFERRLSLLKDHEFIHEGALTEKGAFASWFFGYELLCAEMHENGDFHTYSPHELCCALCSLVCEEKRGPFRPTPPPRRVTHIIRAIDAAFMRVHQREITYAISPTTPRPHHDLAAAVDCWTHGGTFAETVELSRRDEGSVVRSFRMVIQLLRQLSLAPHVTADVQKTSRAGRALMDRGVVDAEKQLRA